MKVRLDAVITEIAETLDVNLMRHDPNFATLPRFQRMHCIIPAHLRIKRTIF